MWMSRLRRRSRRHGGRRGRFGPRRPAAARDAFYNSSAVREIRRRGWWIDVRQLAALLEALQCATSWNPRKQALNV